MRTTDQVIPMPGWALCRTLVPVSQTKSGLFLARDMETGKTTECVAEVLAVSDPYGDDGVTRVFSGVRAGDRVLIRDFLKFANAVGDMVGADRNDRVFLLHTRDVLAVVEGKGTIGFYGEYEL